MDKTIKGLSKQLSLPLLPHILLIVFPNLIQLIHFRFCRRILLYKGILFYLPFLKFLKNLLGIWHFRVRLF